MPTIKNVIKITFNRTMSKVCGLFKDQVPRNSAKKGSNKTRIDLYRGNAFLIRFCRLKSKFSLPGHGLSQNWMK
ncbi:hypothetical protein EPI10_016634 [Gossypium australe]|uniref:Uncharacterized protein n=1 Tax=Gossypium australe TaxID=47621 RepID=A0A5B6VNN9_9ROSI|nr:hypothetical protein EPI10_016634 [Gossypium australe]